MAQRCSAFVMPSCSNSESKSSNLRAATHLGIGSNLEMAHCDRIERWKRRAGCLVSFFDVNIPTEDAGANMAAARLGRITNAVYLAAIGLATIGWLWLIVWIVRQII